MSSTDDWKKEYEAPEGQIWLCAACGRTDKNRANNGDESCFLNSILVFEQKNPEGKWVTVPDQKR